MRGAGEGLGIVVSFSIQHSYFIISLLIGAFKELQKLGLQSWRMIKDMIKNELELWVHVTALVVLAHHTFFFVRIYSQI